MISRTGFRIVGLSHLKPTGYLKKMLWIQHNQSLLYKSSCLLFSSQKKDGTRDGIPELHEAESHAEEQQKEHVFSESHSRDTVDRVDVQVTNHMSLNQMTSSNFQGSNQGPSNSQIEEMSHYDGHNMSGSVSLSSVMQSSVPEPYQTSARGSPSHMNMPGGGVKLADKFVAGHIKDVHPSRKFSTASYLSTKLEDNRYTPYSDCQGPQGDMKFEYLARLENPCPQGIQGEDCERFKLWLQNCVRYGGKNCDQDLLAFQTGRKSLNDIFVEQERLIYQVAAQQRRYYSTSSGEKPAEKNSVDSDSVSTVTPENANLSQREKLKRAVRDYGATVVVFHVTISLMSLGTAYLLVSSGLDVVGLLKKMGLGEGILANRLAAGASTFVVAYAVHKVFAPARIATTLTATPFIVRYLRKIGMLKPPKAVPKGQ